MIFETHAHYNDNRYRSDREEVLKRLRDSDIAYVVNVGADIGSSKESILLAEQHDFIYASVGVHPHDAASLTDDDLSWLKSASAHQKVVAVGEIGLDYYYEHSEKDIQKTWFRRQLQLAREVNLPVIIHSRDAAQDTIEIMKDCEAQNIGGVVHCFSYAAEIAEVFLDMGFYIGIGGVVTFSNARKLLEAVKAIPLTRILLETDAPYLAPEPHRGQRNESTFIPSIAQKIADIKCISYEEVVQTTFDNAMEMYRMTSEVCIAKGVCDG